MIYLDDHGYDAESKIMEEIPAGGDFSFELLSKDEQLLVIPSVRRTLRMAGLPSVMWTAAPRGRRGD